MTKGKSSVKLVFFWLDFFQGKLKDMSGNINLSIASLSSFLKQSLGERISIRLIHEILDSDWESRNTEIFSRIDESFKKDPPDVVCYSTMVNNAEVTKKVSEYIKKKYGVMSLIGGIAPSLSPEKFIGFPGVDGLCIGEGEYPLKDVCQRILQGETLEKIENFWLKKSDGTIEKNSLRPVIESLDSLPPMDYSIFDPAKIGSFHTRIRNIFTLFSRGCPNNCSFCANAQIKKFFGGGKIRWCSPETAVHNLAIYVETFPGLRSLYFIDDVVPHDLDWLRTFSAEYKKRICLPFRCQIPVNLMKEEHIKLLKEAGCFSIVIGVETGSETRRKGLLKKMISDKKLLEIVKLCSSFDISVRPYVMIGLPDEEMQDMVETIKFVACNGFKSPPLVSIFTPIDLTELGEFCKKNNLIQSSNDFNDFFTGSNLRKPKEWHDNLMFVNQYWDTILALFYYIQHSRYSENKRNQLHSEFQSVLCTRDLKLLEKELKPLKDISILQQMYRSSEKDFLEEKEIPLKAKDVFDYWSPTLEIPLFELVLQDLVQKKE